MKDLKSLKNLTKKEIKDIYNCWLEITFEENEIVYNTRAKLFLEDNNIDNLEWAIIGISREHEKAPYLILNFDPEKNELNIKTMWYNEIIDRQFLEDFKKLDELLFYLKEFSDIKESLESSNTVSSYSLSCNIEETKKNKKFTINKIIKPSVFVKQVNFKVVVTEGKIMFEQGDSIDEESTNN